MADSKVTMSDEGMSPKGHFRRFEAVADESGLPPTPDVSLRRSEPTLRAILLLMVSPWT